MILHIGAPKCGSSFLQHAMLQNDKLLRKCSILYPQLDPAHPGTTSFLNDISSEMLEEWFSQADTLFFSHENWMARAPTCADKFLERIKPFDVKIEVIVFLRPFHEFSYADISQSFKQDFTTYLKTRTPLKGLSFEEHAQKRANDIRVWEFLEDWANFVGVENISVHSSKHIQQVVERILDLNVLNWEIPVTKVNKSLRISDCDRLVEMLQDETCSDEEIIAFFQSAYLNIGLHDEGRTPTRTKLFQALFERHYTYLRERFNFEFSRDEG